MKYAFCTYLINGVNPICIIYQRKFTLFSKANKLTHIYWKISDNYFQMRRIENLPSTTTTSHSLKPQTPQITRTLKPECHKAPKPLNLNRLRPLIQNPQTI